MTDYKAVTVPDQTVEIKRRIEELKIQVLEQRENRLTEEAKWQLQREQERGVRNRREARLKIHALEEENARLRLERDQARQPIEGQHDRPDDCPTYHDGCHCNVETLTHNISRAEAAEAKMKQLTRQLEELT